MLPETTLAMIVRDELQNSAGGLARCLGVVLPQVTQAVIIDTGSTDGTYEYLQKLAQNDVRVHIDQIVFKGFGHARDYSLSHVRTRRALVLDADELIQTTDYLKLSQTLGCNPHVDVWGFDVLNIYVGHEKYAAFPIPRLFDMKPGRGYSAPLWEWLNDDHVRVEGGEDANIDILHFHSSMLGRKTKVSEFYSRFENALNYNFSKTPRRFHFNSPTDNPCSSIWKQVNPRRDEYV